MLETYILPQRPSEGALERLNPSIQVLESTDTYGKIVLEPLQRGYGITVGNPLRRMLLSSIKGAAITRVKIENVAHEYTAIPGVKEEVMDLLLNIKRIRIHSETERTGKMRLEVGGEGRICAGDIATSPDFEIVNPELHLATLDNSDSSLSIEFTVEPGVGYQPATQGEVVSGLPVGELPVDAIFNPVRKVDYSVERTRVGQMTDYERLVLELWTDGTITPVDALKQAANTLVDHFFLYRDLSFPVDGGASRATFSLSPEIYQTPIERLDLPARIINCLRRANISRVGEILEMSDEDLLKIRNFGSKALSELREKLAEHGVGAPVEGQPATPALSDPALAYSPESDSDWERTAGELGNPGIDFNARYDAANAGVASGLGGPDLTGATVEAADDSIETSPDDLGEPEEED